MRRWRTVVLALAFALWCVLIAGATSPLIANHSFASNSFTSWAATTPSYTGSCAASSGFASVASPAEDADGGASQGSSGATTTCASGGTATIGETQTFSIAGTPTAQTYSYWYNITQVTAGDPVNCVQGVGTVSEIDLTLNSTTFQTLSPTMDGAWHQVTGSTSALVSGSNTITIKSVNQSATGTQRNPTICGATVNTAQPTTIDNIVLTATIGSNQYFGSWRR